MSATQAAIAQGRGSILRRIRMVDQVFDLAVFALLSSVTYNVYRNFMEGTFATRRKHLTNMPPALVAQDFDFSDISKNRTVDRSVLDAHWAEARPDKANKAFLY